MLQSFKANRLRQLRWLATLCLTPALPLLGCNQLAPSDSATGSAPGLVELVLGSIHGDACAGRAAVLPGELQLRGVDGMQPVAVPGSELLLAGAVKRSLPPGLYSLEWQANTTPDGQAVVWTLPRPPMLNVFPARATRVVLHRQLQPCAPEPFELTATTAPGS